MKALWMQCKIEILRTVRNKFFLFFSWVMPISFYTFFTRVMVSDQVVIEEWVVRSLISMTIFSIISSSMFSIASKEIMDKKSGWVDFVRLTPLPSFYYFSAKMVAQLLVSLLTILVVFPYGMILNQVALPWEVWIQVALWILIASLPFLALGTAIGNMKKMETAAIVANILVFTLATLGGLWMPLEMFPEAMQSIALWLPSYRYGEGAWNLIDGEPIAFSAVVILFVYFVLFMLLSIYMRRRQEAM